MEDRVLGVDVIFLFCRLPNPQIPELNDVSIVAQAFLFLIAGFDTTSNSLSFFVKALGMYPDYQKTIREELIARMKADGRDKLTYEDVMEAKWLEAFLAGL